MEHVAHFFLDFVDHFGYVGLFFVMLLANVGVPVGAELVVPAAGALVATGHLSSVVLVGLVATAGEFLGNCILYAVGYAGGRPFVARYGRYVKLSEKKLDAFHAFYDRYGNAVVFVCRFLPFVRGVSALPAGVSRMQKRYFATYTLAGSTIFCFGLAYLGSAFGSHLSAFAPHIHQFFIALLVLAVLAVAAFVAYRFSRGRVAAR